MVTNDFCINTYRGITSKNMMNQTYFMPHPMLRQYIANYTLLYSTSTYTEVADTTPEDLIIIPDASGCFIFGFDNWGAYKNCWGPTSKPVKVKKNNLLKDERMFFIEFLPGGLSMLTGVEQKELKDMHCTISDISRKLAMILSDVIQSADGIDHLVSEVDRILLSWIENNSRKQLNITSAIHKIRLSRGNISIKRLAESEYISERHLRRLFEREIGLSVKMFARLTRLNNSLRVYKSNRNRSDLNMLQDGFFDESHFIRDFKEFCGTTPQSFIKNMSGFYNEPFKY
ncbi:helix-turn-helix transcriptional regulator [Vallitalea okinawensis]|uniref:helix-turn-helix transcriptional regulator n=1 Tax=Vallitalea okinawensis TaxID=2078660 RepID=UPI000CFD728C|nr:helix-turn-helix transcriptional regulator [Vallitalea okinawensis]